VFDVSLAQEFDDLREREGQDWLLRLSEIVPPTSSTEYDPLRTPPHVTFEPESEASFEYLVDILCSFD
jgi:hypothetical protein